MSLFKWIKGGSSQRRSRTSTDAQTQPPCFERLEDRVLLSADVSLVHDIQLLDTEVEQVISVDLEPGFGSGSQTVEAGVEEQKVGTEEEKIEAEDDLESGSDLTDDAAVILDESEVKTDGDHGQVLTGVAIDFSAENTKTSTEADASVSYDNESEDNYTDELPQTLLAANPPPTGEASDVSSVSANSLLENQLQENTTPENLLGTDGSGDVRIGDLQG
ncbi:MAG: LEPR-XLL domain-containing protein, partial [bacterium]|nr:LEPR-XLL domain-containing protein [bacterium]